MSLCVGCLDFFFFKQKTAYEMRISDWSSDVCSSDLLLARVPQAGIDEIRGDIRYLRIFGFIRKNDGDPSLAHQRNEARIEKAFVTHFHRMAQGNAVLIGGQQF